MKEDRQDSDVPSAATELPPGVLREVGELIAMLEVMLDTIEGAGDGS